jgi:hypothetical protein
MLKNKSRYLDKMVERISSVGGGHQENGIRQVI